MPQREEVSANRSYEFDTGCMSTHTTARVLMTVGDVAELTTPLHPASAPLRVPSSRIAEQADLPANELPGRLFTVEQLSATDADGFRLASDPRT
jgi:hypothetical protein